MNSAAPATPSTDFFVSFTQADKDWAEWIAWQLEADGYRVVFQPWDFPPGGNFVLNMDDATKTAQRTIAVLSEGYLAASFASAEWAAAFRLDPAGARQRLLSVRVRDCQPAGLLATIGAIELVGLDEAEAKRVLLAGVRPERGKPETEPRFPGRSASAAAVAPPAFPGPADDVPAPLRTLRSTLARHASAELDFPELARETLAEILAHSPRTLNEYRLGRIAEWSQPRHALNKRFTRLTLLLDQGQDAQGVRWQAQPQTFDDLRQVLAAAVDAPALVVLGPPGCGKSTLLRRLELDLACAALRAGGGEGEPQGTTSADADADADESVITFFVPLNRYRPVNPGAALPLPGDWLTAEWARRTPDLPALADILRGRRLLLLLDAVNEIPHTDAADYEQRIELWRDFLARPPTGWRMRAIYSCRSLDYSASLSTPELSVPHVRIEQLSDRQVEDFLAAYSPAHGADLWRQLRGTPQLDLFRSPFYLRLLIAQAGEGGPLLRGRAALFTGFVRQALLREIEAGNRLFRPGFLLDRRDHEHIVRRAWRNALDLPTRGPLLPALSRLAHALQARRAPGEASRVRVPWDDACQLLAAADAAPAAELLHAGGALQVLEEQWDDILYVHQLLQEYFAARALAAHPQPEPALVAGEWRADRVSPSLSEVLAGLGDADPLPALPGSGWEETFVLAAALAPRADDFVAAVGAVNLPLAGRCAAQPDVAVSEPLRRRLQDELIARSRDPAADLRARIAAARALGELGDPRYERRRGPHGAYLLPPLVAIAGGDYPLGSDEGLYDDEAPAHRVPVAGFAIARFALSNAEWRLFIEAGGYDDERWWEGEAARAWQRGEGTADGPKQQSRDNRRWVQDNLAAVRRMPAEGRMTSQQLANWENWCAMSDGEFEEVLDGRYPSGRQTQPAYWNDPAYNDAAQPVVGLCWYEARAYCAWLSAQTGQPWRLPSEAEWEAAARGEQGRRYAWGDDFDAARANTFATHVRGTTPLGVFPGGDTPQGLADMSGNVWEWTSSVYRRYPYTADREREDPDRADARRVVRGGSWLGNRDGARCAYRVHDRPGYRNLDLGVRVVCVSPILLDRCPPER